MHNYEQTKLWNKFYILLLLLSTIKSIGFSMVTPIIAKYAISMGASIGIAGTIAGIFSITALIGRPFSGYISDRYNKKNIMLIATILLALATLGYGLSANYSMLFVFRILHGLAFSISGTASIAMGTLFIPQNRLGEGIGFLGLGIILSRAIGPNLGILLLDNLGYDYVFYGAFLIVAIAAVLMTTFKYKHIPNPADETNSKLKIKMSDLVSKEVLVIAILGGSFAMMNGIINSFLVNLGEEKNIVGIGAYFTVNAVVLLGIRPFAGKLLDKKGLNFIAYPAFVLAIISGLVLGAATSIWMILTASVLYAVAQGSSQPAFQTSCIKKLGPHKVGVATSTYFIGADIGQGLGPMIGGSIAGALNYSSVYYFGSVILLIGLVLYYFYALRNKKVMAEKALAQNSAGQPVVH